MVAKPFKGTINVDIRDSEPDWTPFESPVAPFGKEREDPPGVAMLARE
jgi:hypothetical protein